MSEPLVQVDTPHEHVRVLTLNRPEKRNALNIPLAEALYAAIEKANHDTDARVLILRGAGPAFCAGLDLTEARVPEKAEESARTLARTLKDLSTSPLVTIAAVHGAAIAGGAGFMLACDIAVAADNLKTGFPEVRRGLVAGLVMTFVRRKAPEATAKELLLLGELIDAKTALQAGLIHRVVPEAQLMETAMGLAGTALKCAPMAISRTKRLYDELWSLPVNEHLDRAVAIHKDMRSTADAREGFAAFAEKRLPNWDPESNPPAE